MAIDWSKAEKFVSKKQSKKDVNKGRIVLAVKVGSIVNYKDKTTGAVGEVAAHRFAKAYVKAE